MNAAATMEIPKIACYAAPKVKRNTQIARTQVRAVSEFQIKIEIPKIACYAAPKVKRNTQIAQT